MANPLFAYWFSNADDLMAVAEKIGTLFSFDDLEKHQQPNGEWVADAQGFMSLSRNFDTDRCVLQIATAEAPDKIIASLENRVANSVQWGEIRPTDSGYAFMPMQG